MPENVALHDKILRIAWWVLLAVIVGLTSMIRIRLLGIPLERDEGEYAYAGQLLLQGIPPYQLAYNMKFPGTYAAYALIMAIFGQTIAGIHLGLLVVNAATILLVFLLGRRLLNSTAGIAAAASYAILSLSPSVLGFAGHATHFVVLPVLGGALLLLRPSHLLTKRLVFASGVLFGIGLLMKQPAAFFVPFGVGYLFYRDWRAQLGAKQRLVRSAIFVCGVSLPLAATCLWLWRAGVFEKFWFWTVTYTREYGSLVSLSEGTQVFLKTIAGVIGSGWALWTLAALGAVACLSDKNTRAKTTFVLSLLAFSALAVCPGFHFRQHYFILVLPPICLFVGLAVVSGENLFSRYSGPVRFIPLVLFAAALALPLLAEKPFFFATNPIAASRMIYGLNPFPEAIRIAEYLQEHTDPNEKIAVLGSEPEIFFYSNRRSATGYIYTYGLMEPHAYALQMQREMIREVEAARPKYLVAVRVSTSWAARSNSETLIYDWFGNYSTQHFAIVGAVNIVSSEQTDYQLPARPESIQLSRNYVLIYERKP